MAMHKAAIIGITGGALLLIAGGILWSAMHIQHIGPDVAEESSAAETTLITTTETTESTETTVTTTETAPPMTSFMANEDASQPYLTVAKAAELQERAEILAATYPDFVGWLYIANSAIDYPIVRANNNDYYLHRNINSQYEFKGSIFMDYRSPGDLSNQTNIIYGHNMNNGEMFHAIKTFRSKGSFDAHRYGWIFTGNTVYRLDFFALSVLNAYDDMYGLAYFTIPERDLFVERAYATAHFRRDMNIGEHDKLVMLSTCAYDFELARQILTAKMVTMYSETQYVR